MAKKDPEKTISIPLEELRPMVLEDTTDRQIERIARGVILGTTQIGKQRQIKQDLEQKVVKKIGRKGKLLTDKLFELIEGVSIVDKRSDGKTMRYYQVPPNLQAIIYALDRVLGKPTQHTEHTEEQRGLLTVEHIIKHLASPKEYAGKSTSSEDVVDGEFEDKPGIDKGAGKSAV